MKKNVIVDKSFQLSLEIIRCYRSICKDEVGKAIGKQLLRSGTSVGANIQEAQGAQSRADFIHKLTISHKEIKETLYWLRLLSSSMSSLEFELRQLCEEAREIEKILASILVTTKERKNQDLIRENFVAFAVNS